jgi:phosphate transport system substrate-binding protein
MKTKNIKISYLASLVLVILLSAFTVPQKIITMKGSDTMLILAQRWAEVYMKEHNELSIQVTGRGSGMGIDELINGMTDICNSSRIMTKKEVNELKQRFSTIGVEIPCARDGITIYLNEDNPVNELTMKQISDIYAGRIANWKQVGGNSAPINLYGRESNSGTYVVFKEKVVKTDYSQNCQVLPGNMAIVNAVIRDPNGIGYGGAAFARGVKKCKVKRTETSPAYEPNIETIINNQYPISRYLYIYTRNRPTGKLKRYINWILSPDGQKVVEEVGYFPLPE